MAGSKETRAVQVAVDLRDSFCGGISVLGIEFAFHKTHRGNGDWNQESV